MSQKDNKEIIEQVKESTSLEQVKESTSVEEVVSDEKPVLDGKKTQTTSQNKKSPKKVNSKKENQENEFDWDQVSQNDIYSEKERGDQEKEYIATLPNVIDKQVMDGTVVLITDREVIVDVNFKSDGIISFNEFKYNPDLKVGDSVEVLVEKQEDKNGQLVLSHRRARVLRAWEKVNIALETGEVVNGQIKSRTKGGMIVDVFGIECFLPGSQIDVKPIRDYDEYVGKKMEFKVVL